MGLLTGVFLFNLMCSLVPCDFFMPEPQVQLPHQTVGKSAGNSTTTNPLSNIQEVKQRARENSNNVARSIVSQDFDEGSSILSMLGQVLQDFNSNANIFDEDLNFEVTEEKNPVVKTNSGLVRGFKMTSMDGQLIHAFEGIPYAESTEGYNRFRAPVPKKSWNGILEANQKLFCLQIHYAKLFRVVGTEDCLVVNVYSNSKHISKDADQIPESELLPVIVFIHGGSFVFGAGFEYGPTYLMNQNVVYVTMNYRVGVLGFLSTADDVCPGNNGLKDQSLALKWVYENVKNFGGNPNKISLQGQSAGGVSSHLQLLSNSSRGYFQSGISMSGSAFDHWGIIPHSRALSFAHKLAQIVHCPTESSQKLVDCMRATNPSMLVGVQMQLPEWIPFPPVLFGPVLEPESPEAFLTQNPVELYKQNKVQAVPWIFSITSQEGYVGLYGLHVLGLHGRIGKLRRDMDKYLPIYLDYKYLKNYDPDVSEKIQNFYFPQKTEYFDDATIADMGADRYFHVGIKRAIKFHSQIAPSYGLMFDFLSQYNAGSFFGIPKKIWGVGHGEDIFFLYNATQYSEGFKRTDEEYKLSQIMINIVINFADKKEPLFSEGNSTLVKIWDPIIYSKNENISDINYLILNKNIKMVPDPYFERTKFWEQIGLSDFPEMDYELNSNNYNH